MLAKLAASGPSRDIEPPTRGRLALYNLIDETPHGWKITPFGRATLATSQQIRKPKKAEPWQPNHTDEEPERRQEPRRSGERNYGRRPRSGPWLS